MKENIVELGYKIHLYRLVQLLIKATYIKRAASIID